MADKILIILCSIVILLVGLVGGVVTGKALPTERPVPECWNVIIGIEAAPDQWIMPEVGKLCGLDMTFEIVQPGEAL